MVFPVFDTPKLESAIWDVHVMPQSGDWNTLTSGLRHTVPNLRTLTVCACVFCGEGAKSFLKSNPLIENIMLCPISTLWDMLEEAIVTIIRGSPEGLLLLMLAMVTGVQHARPTVCGIKKLITL